MSVLIPTEHMEMPKSCVKCIFMQTSRCKVIPKWMSQDMANKLYHGRHDKCPLTELIHCKDCIHHKPFPFSEEHICDVFDWESEDKDFCSFAERRTE